MPFKGRGRPHAVMHQIVTDIPLYEVKDQQRKSHILHRNWLFLVMSEVGVPLHVGVCQVQDRCTSPTPVKLTPEGSDSKTMPQGDNGLVSTQHQARKTPLGWINGKLWLLLWTSTRVSTEDRWRFQVMCSGHGCLPWQNGQKAYMCLVEAQMSTCRYQWTGWLLWLLTDLECGSKTTGVWNRYTPLHVKFFDDESSSTLMQNTPAQSLRDLGFWHLSGLIPLFHLQKALPTWLDQTN